MFVTDKRLRLSGSGARIRIHKRGNWKDDQIEGLKVCWRASIGLEKALGEAIRQARDAGVSWKQIGRALGVAETASDEADVREAVIIARRAMSQQFWTNQE